mgnify:CR=1 FL=1
MKRFGEGGDFGNSTSIVKSYMEYFGFEKRPFFITPDTEFFFLSNSHREALNHLLYGIHEGMGFVMITGEVGTGKTLLSRYFVENAEKKIETALILNPRVSEKELLWLILTDLGHIFSRSYRSLTKVGLLELFNRKLLESYSQGKRVAVIIDEAQDLEDRVLEFLRLLSNLETHKDKLMTIVLLGQPELERKLKNRNLRQLKQRILVRHRLEPLEKDEIGVYIDHRITLAAPTERPYFDGAALNQLYRYSGGIPRLINAAAELALIAAYIDGQHRVEKRHVAKAIDTLEGTDRSDGRKSWIRRILRF